MASLSSGLYLVATPIGNLKDITLRALDVLRQVDMVACEDTRTSRTLLNHYGIAPPRVIPYHDFSDENQRQRILQAIQGGAAVALISDAGTPLIADPGYKLVQACYDAGLPVVPIPGPCAAVAGVMMAGLPTNRFVFVGFISPKDLNWPRETTVVGYVACHDVPKVLSALDARFGDQMDLSLCREITKLHEGIFRGTPQTVSESLSWRAQQDPKIMGGEWVLVAHIARQVLDPQTLFDDIKALVQAHGVKQAVTIAQGMWDLPRKTLYTLALKAAAEDTPETPS
ncbi:MAG: 16S rRNA (cytidine(1402)-2'-O)-methyltransferase [Alphaproteobacteria bacterium]